MAHLKRLIYLLAVLAVASCKNASTSIELPPAEYKEPVTEALVFSKPQKIRWDTIKAVNVTPVVKPLNLDKLPVRKLDTDRFKPFKYPVEEVKFDYNSLPESSFDLTKVPSHPLKFKTFLLPPPKLIKSGPPHLKNIGLSLFEMGENQGLQGAIVTCVYTDSDGFLWIATDQGLYRYDGENIILYISGPISHYIIGMQKDNQGRIWMANLDAGIQVLDLRDGTLMKADKSSGLSDNSALRLLIDAKQQVWITLAPGCADVIDSKTLAVKPLGKIEGKSKAMGLGLAMDEHKNVWLATLGGVDIIDQENKKLKHIGKAQGLKTDSAFNVIYTCGGRAVITTLDGTVNILDAKTNKIERIKEEEAHNPQISGLLQDDKGLIWITKFNGGVAVIDPVRRMDMKLKSGDGLFGDGIIGVTKDKSGQIWVPINAGLNMIGNNKVIINRIGTSQTNTLMEDSHGLVWQGTSKGIELFSPDGKTTRHLTLDGGPGTELTETINQVGQKMFIGTGGSFNIIDSAKTTITLLDKQHGLASLVILAFVTDNAGRIWIAGDKGLEVYDPETHARKYLGEKQGLKKGRIDDLRKDAAGRIWVSMESVGIVVIDPAKMLVRYLKNNAQLLNGNYPIVLFPDTKGNMWIGGSNGVYIANFDGKTFTAITTQQGLISNQVTTILQRKNMFYVGTRRGITVISPPFMNEKPGKNWAAKSFSIIQNYPGSSLTDMVDKDGLYWFGDKGLTVLDLSKVDSSAAAVFVTGINTMDHPNNFIDQAQLDKRGTDTLWGSGANYYLKGKTPLLNMGYTVQGAVTWDNISGPFNLPVNLTLPHNQNFMQFHFSSPDVTNHDTIWYRYKLIGADTAWNAKTPATTSRNYFSLVPGDYTFEVVAKASGSNWGKPAGFSFTIKPPWWQTWWAYILCIAGFAGVLWGFVYYRSQQLLKEKRILEHKIRIRTEEVIQQKEEIEAQRDHLEKAFGDLKNTQTQLVQSEKLASLGELTAGIAHEIQNPLNFVNNFAEVSIELVEELKEEQSKPVRNVASEKDLLENLEQNLQKINLHGKRADGIVKNMLQHSRNNSGERELTDINNLADEYFRLSYHGLRAKDKSFNSAMETNLDTSLPKVSVVPQDIGRVVLNLFNNAFYAVNHKKKNGPASFQPMVSLITINKKGIVEIKVRDNGNGIPEAIKDKIMQPFFTTKPTGEGTGLGLSLSHEIIKAHGGNIHIDTKEGEFTEFTLSLPVS